MCMMREGEREACVVRQLVSFIHVALSSFLFILADMTSKVGADDSSATLTVGFLGLGIMGTPMARNLLKAGYVINHQT